MRSSVFDNITEGLVNSGVITDEDKELYTYGLKQGFWIIINIVTTILIGILFRMLWQSILFTVIYVPLRTYAGGYHSKTHIRCYLFSIVMISAVLLGIKYVPWTDFICLSVTLCAWVIIFICAPVEDKNKPLDSKEIRIYKNRARVILQLESVIFLLVLCLGFYDAAVVIAISLFVMSIMLLLGKSKNLLGYGLSNM